MGRGRPRQPINLIIAKDKKHLTEAEIEKRRAEEVDVPFVDIAPPEYLTDAKHIKEFNYYAGMLTEIGIFTELDVNVLGQYILTKEMYINYTKQLEQIIAKATKVQTWLATDALIKKFGKSGDSGVLIELLEKILARERGDDATVLMNLQNKAFGQCMACAKELGLTISSRCKLIVPQPPSDGDDEL